MTDKRRLVAIRQALAMAARVCRRVAGLAGEIRAHTKDDRSPVTVADYASQAIVTKILRDYTGEFRLVAEESAEDFQASGLASQGAVLEALRADWSEVTLDDIIRLLSASAEAPPLAGFWALDPIDGTKGFLRRQQYAIALAWLEQGEPIAGGVAVPNLSPQAGADLTRPSMTGSVFIAERGNGVLCGSSEDMKEEHRPLGPVRSRDHLVLCAPVEAEHADVDGTRALLELLGGGEALRVDSQCKYVLVARGEADAYLRLPRDTTYQERIWDHAAGALVATEAGCIVSDLDGKALDFSLGRVLAANRGILCASPKWHGRVLEALQRIG